MSSEMGFPIDPQTLTTVLVFVLGFLIIYFFFLIRALVEMIRFDAPGVVIVFTYISLIPFPLFLILGIVNLIIWYFVRKDLIVRRGTAA